jgi:hypothetical protein
MPVFYLFHVRCRWRFLAALGLSLAGSSCARRHYFQTDARVGAGSAQPLPPTADSVLATAGRQYNRHSGFYYLFLGRHYRRVWAAPVRVPVLRLATAVPGGLRPGKTGGGYQSISMTLEGNQQREYALRALDKEPRKTLPKVIQTTFVLNVVRDATSAAIPYGALTVTPLAQAAGVPHTNPRIVYVRPDETGLGAQSELFQGKLALLEEKFNARASATPDLAGATGFAGGEAMLKQVYRHPTHYIDQPAFLRARLLDVWLGDWDRHEGQWSWAEFREAGGRVRYLGIPKDRDQVYFRFDDGMIPWLAARRGIAPKFQTFRNEYNSIVGLVHQAQFIDQRALSRMTRADFARTALDLQRRLPDSVIARALRRLPPAVQALESARLGAALRARRASLPQAADAYYRTLARTPVVGGTARAERFVVYRYADSTTVSVFSALEKQQPAGNFLHFQRTYFPAETRYISLSGLGADDIFEITTTPGARPMRLRLYGGAGHDELRLQGSAHRLRCYDEPGDLAVPGAPRFHPPRQSHRPYDRLNDD